MLRLLVSGRQLAPRIGYAAALLPNDGGKYNFGESMYASTHIFTMLEKELSIVKANPKDENEIGSGYR